MHIGGGKMNTTVEKRKKGPAKRFGDRTLHVRIPENDLEKLASLASLEGLTVSDIVRKQIRNAIALKQAA